MTSRTKVTVPHISDGSAQRSDGQHAPSAVRPSRPVPNQISFAPFIQLTFRLNFCPFCPGRGCRSAVITSVSVLVRRLDRVVGLRNAIRRSHSVGYERLM